MELVVPAPVAPTLAVAGRSARFPVRRVFCVGRNYAAHAREMGGDPTREAPFFFGKPGDAVLDASMEAPGRVPYPPLTADLHHEVELVVALGAGGTDVPPADALSLVWGYAVGLDLTRRDLQNASKKAGRPWEDGKAFDRSAPVGPLVPAAEVGDPTAGRIWCAVDGEVRQDADLGDLVWSVAEVLAALSRSVALAPGDLVFTGTPAGVGPIRVGQRVTAGVAGLPGCCVDVVAP